MTDDSFANAAMQHGDPFEGLPAHMIESRPYKVKVSVHRPARVKQGTIALDARPEQHWVQLERDGRKLMMTDRPIRWARGEAEGFKPTKFVNASAPEEIIVTDIEEEIDHEH